MNFTLTPTVLYLRGIALEIAVIIMLVNEIKKIIVHTMKPLPFYNYISLNIVLLYLITDISLLH